MRRRIIVVTGTPGTGKTTFARMLTRELRGEYLSLGKYITKHRLFSGRDKKRRTKVVDITRTSSRMQQFAHPNVRPLVVDSHHPEGIVPNNVTAVVFVLRCDPAILKRRLRRKKWSPEKIRENLMAEVLDSCYITARSYYASRKLVQLDTSHTNAKRSVEIAKNILSGKKAPAFSVNWLGELQNGTSLAKYLGC
jgi:adenylate kinase